MSLKITRVSTAVKKGLYVIKPKGLKAVKTDSIDEVGAVIAHYFGGKEDRARHDIYKRRGLCPLCNAMDEEAKKDA
ncbi:hypothetical protein LCGC14_3002310 [marine sediment metagenome]|uniref:Uncharacterized protein n=1 Tax=marine sediment metagenome TaxID=412755 RepID=A0A0F8XN92_9ZZZZ